ncbi:MAG: zinc dependent phospholipase C family protein [Candidatus Korobacteraceae bacterium]
MGNRSRSAWWYAALAVTMLVAAQTCVGYSVLTHEEIIDLLWEQQMQPLLLARFPDATPDDLIKAHAYAYGGSVIQDVGYYPFGSHLFSDLTHYVRTGDFVKAMLDDAEDLNEYAFALGALSHYVADINGHPYINLSVGISYPKLARDYGPAVPYDVDHKAHLKTEFGFDVLQVAKGRYAPKDYHNFIGFEVSQPLLERAFYDTYGIQLKAVMPHEGLAIGTYRRSVSQVIPEVTKVALAAKGDQLQQEIPDFNRRAFLYHLSDADYRKSWGTDYEKPGFGARLLAVLFKVLPKVGPLRAVNFKEPTPKTEDLYFKSVDQTFSHFRTELTALKNQDIKTPNIDLDTGKPTARGEYPLADLTYRELLDKLASDHFEHTDEALRQDIVHFFNGHGVAEEASRIDPCDAGCRLKTWIQVNQLRAVALLDPADRPQPQQPTKTSMRSKDGAIASSPMGNARM